LIDYILHVPYNEQHTKTTGRLKICIEEDSKSSRRYVSARFASTWFYNQLQIRCLLITLAEGVALA